MEGHRRSGRTGEGVTTDSEDLRSRVSDRVLVSGLTTGVARCGMLGSPCRGLFLLLPLVFPDPCSKTPSFLPKMIQCVEDWSRLDVTRTTLWCPLFTPGP